MTAAAEALHSPLQSFGQVVYFLFPPSGAPLAAARLGRKLRRIRPCELRSPFAALTSVPGSRQTASPAAAQMWAWGSTPISQTARPCMASWGTIPCLPRSRPPVLAGSRPPVSRPHDRPFSSRSLCLLCHARKLAGTSKHHTCLTCPSCHCCSDLQKCGMLQMPTDQYLAECSLNEVNISVTVYDREHAKVAGT